MQLLSWKVEALNVELLIKAIGCIDILFDMEIQIHLLFGKGTVSKCFFHIWV